MIRAPLVLVTFAAAHGRWPRMAGSGAAQICALPDAGTGPIPTSGETTNPQVARQRSRDDGCGVRETRKRVRPFRKVVLNGMARPVLSTYRVQLRGPLSGHGFTLADPESLLDYLDDLGVSHLYLSPILTASTTSAHGYDVTDPTAVSAGLGGPEALARLSDAAATRGMGLIVDIVPNHVGIDESANNRWWWDVLTYGRDSDYASYFDIDWEPGDGMDGRIALPILGSDDDVTDLTVDGETLRLGDLVLPIAPGTGSPRVSSTVCASITRTDCPTPRVT
jgi:hypothetical protein